MSVGQRPSPEFLALQAAVAGRYVLDREIGRGGMGAVFLARDVALERPVAIKLLLPHLAGDAALRERFLREARTAAQLTHPNIVPIYAVEADEDLVYFVMAYVSGVTLAQRVEREGPLSPDDVLAMTRDVAWALAYAHGRGVIHRDIKPDNILLDGDSGRAVIADFGIARVMTQATLTDDGAFVGTAEYMSREQAAAQALDGRSDIYSLGATAFFALVGESPVRAPSLPAVLGRLMGEDGPSITALRPDVPPALASVLSRCLVREREGRVGSADELVSELRALESARPRVRTEIKVFLANVLGLQSLAAMGAGVSILALITQDLGFILPHTRDGFVIAGVGLFALAGLLFVTGLLTLRPQGVAYRELVEGLESEAADAVHTARVMVRKSFGGDAKLFQRSYVGVGVFNVLTCAGFGFAAFRGLMPHGAVTTVAFTLAACAAGVGVGAHAIWRGLQSAEAFEQYRRTRAEGPWYHRVLLKVARHPWIRAWWKRAGSSDAFGGVTGTAPSATLLLERVEDLYRQLPPDTRDRLADLLPTTSRLERVCATLRTKVNQLERAMAELPPGSPSRADFSAARERTAARLADAVTAMEHMRTELLRLSVGLGASDGLTLGLEKARELSAAIDAELHGQSEVKKLLG